MKGDLVNHSSLGVCSCFSILVYCGFDYQFEIMFETKKAVHLMSMVAMIN